MTDVSGRLPKVIHVVENLDRGAVETWLVRMLRHARKGNVALNWTFYCQLPSAGCAEQEAQDLGASVIHSPFQIGQKVGFMAALRTQLRQGKYEIMHCHHDLVSALYLVAAVGLPIRRRLVHVHNADESVLTPSRLKQALLREPMRRMCLRLADRIVGISNHTLDTFLRGRARRPERDFVHYYGVDPAPFVRAKEDRIAFRRSLGLPEESLILLFAGRLVPEKNPAFTLEVLQVLRELEPRAVAVFVGSGSEEQAVAKKISELGFDRHVRLLGWRQDIPEIMVCCDWFILPRPESPMEGFGLAVVEAQLAGLRLLVSRGIADDPLLPGACFRRLSLRVDSAAEWARAAVSLLGRPVPTRRNVAETITRSPLGLDNALESLLGLHRL